MIPADLKARLDARNADMDTRFYVLVSEQQAQDIASGYVPNSVKAQVRTMLDWREEDQRKADAARAEAQRGKRRTKTA